MEDVEWGEASSARGTNVGILSFSRKQGGKSSVRCGLFPPGFRMVPACVPAEINFHTCGNLLACLWNFARAITKFRHLIFRNLARMK